MQRDTHTDINDQPALDWRKIAKRLRKYAQRESIARLRESNILLWFLDTQPEHIHVWRRSERTTNQSLLYFTVRLWSSWINLKRLARLEIFRFGLGAIIVVPAVSGFF